MKREDIDWGVLRGALIGFVVSAAVAGACAGAGHMLQKKQQLEFVRNNAQFQSVSGKYLAVDEEEKQIRKFYPRFLELYRGGIIGHEERLNWIETLRAAGERLRVPALTYEIKSQNVFTPTFPLDLGRFQVYRSQMTVSLQALHEGDLMRLLQLLDTRAAGLHSIDTCRMSRITQDIDTSSAGKANLAIQCELGWYTIKLADGAEIKVET